ncbi:MAG: hypothetical protein ACMUHX_04735, partial [bacterium]
MSDKTKNIFLKEGLVIAGITLISYLVAFAYQYGHAEYFEIPVNIISINLTIILISFASLLGSLYLFYALSRFIWFYTPKENDPVSFRKRLFSKMIIASFWMPLIFSNWIAWVIFLAAIVILAFFLFVLPLITQRDKETYAEKLASDAKANAEANAAKAKANKAKANATKAKANATKAKANKANAEA